MPIHEWLEKEEALHEENLRARIHDQLKEVYLQKEAQVESATLRQFEKAVMLQSLDTLWREHLAAMDYLRQGIHLRGYAQKNPKQEYKRESFELFVALLERINYEVVSTLCKFEVRAEKDVASVEAAHRESLNLKMDFHHADLTNNNRKNQASAESVDGGVMTLAPPFVRDERKVGRNEVCPCGSGRKYKYCHGLMS